MSLRPVPNVPASAKPGPPVADLVVDLDEMLLLADIGAETAINETQLALSRFAAAIRGAKAGLSPNAIAEFARKGIDVSTLPVDADLLAHLADQHAEDRRLHLVSRLEQPIVDALSARLGIFATATGGLADRAAKREIMERICPAGYRLAERPAAQHRHVAPRVWLKALRVHQWAKNALVFVPLLLGHAYTDIGALLACTAGFVLMGLLASGTYLINDLADLASDRRHPTKRNRPLARGDIKAGAALTVAAGLIAASLVGSALISLAFLGTLAAYLCVTLAYSFHLKRLLLIDVFVLAALFTSRIAMGIVLADVVPSSWLLTFTMFFFLSLSLAKRHAEIVNSAERGVTSLAGRDYVAADAPLTVALGVAANAVAMLVAFLYLSFDATPTGLYREPYWLWGAAFVVMLWSLRIWGLAHRGRLDADPVAFAITDRFSLTLGAVVACVFVLAI